MLWTVAVIFSMLWLLGLAVVHTMGSFVHILLFLAIIAILIHIEDDCSNHVLDRTKKWYLKRQWVGVSGKNLPKPAMPSGDKVS